MQTIQSLNDKFASSTTSFESGQGGLTRGVIKNESASATFYAHGAHVESYRPNGHQPVLWMSSQSRFEANSPIRGGIPICWPWFGPHDSEPSFPPHGFARTSQWEVRSLNESRELTQLVMGLTNEKSTQAFFDYEFDAAYQISIGKQLNIELTVTNLGNKSMKPVGCALHSYFQISNIESVTVSGLENIRFLDKLNGLEELQSGSVEISSETDRVYFNPPADVCLLDQGLQREVHVSGSGSRSTVVWNPWIDKSKRMDDFPNDGYREMICIETANALDDVREIGPGEQHRISQTIEVKGI